MSKEPELQISLRSQTLTPIGVERMGEAADAMANPAVLRLENLDCNIPPPVEALAVTTTAALHDKANSYLPFFGHNELRKSVTALVTKLSGVPQDTYDWRKQCFISAGGLNGLLNVLLACINPGDEVVMPSPIYVGLINRVKLAGGIPKFIHLIPNKTGWRLDVDSIAKAVSHKTRAFIMMSPAMPTGMVFNLSEWQAISKACVAANAWMIYDSAMERLLFDNVAHIHPASLPDMLSRTITVGALSKEYRMIGWRVGWVVCPMTIAEALGRVSLSNVVSTVGMSQLAAVAAITSANDGIVTAANELELRRDLLLTELADFNVIKPHGGWSLLIDMQAQQMSGKQASELLLKNADIAATSIENWGEAGVERYLRVVFSNEPLVRLQHVGDKFKRAFELAR